MSLKGIVLGTALGLVACSKGPDCEFGDYGSNKQITCEYEIGAKSEEAKQLYKYEWLLFEVGGAVSYRYSDTEIYPNPKNVHTLGANCKVTLENDYFKWNLYDYDCEGTVDRSEYKYILRQSGGIWDNGFYDGVGLSVTKEELDRKDNPKLFEEYDKLFKTLKSKTYEVK